MSQRVYFLQGVKTGTFSVDAISEDVYPQPPVVKTNQYQFYHVVVVGDGGYCSGGGYNTRHGATRIVSFKISDTEISFEEHIGGNHENIKYSFLEKKDNVWHGTYSPHLVDADSVTAKLILTPIEETFK